MFRVVLVQLEEHEHLVGFVLDLQDTLAPDSPPAAPFYWGIHNSNVHIQGKCDAVDLFLCHVATTLASTTPTTEDTTKEAIVPPVLALVLGLALVLSFAFVLGPVNFHGLRAS